MAGIMHKVTLNIEGVSALSDEFTEQLIAHLKVWGNKLALFVYFGELKLNYKRP